MFLVVRSKDNDFPKTTNFLVEKESDLRKHCPENPFTTSGAPVISPDAGDNFSNRDAGDREHRLPGNVNFCFEGIEGESMLLLLAGIPTLFAQQTVRNDIFAYLKHEGYAPALDKDSDIEFKIQGILYNIIVKQIENEDYAYVEVLANFGTVTPYDKLMEIANDINQNKFVCKCSVSRNENRNVFTLAMEFVTNSRANTEYQMSHALRLLPAWVKELNDRVDE